MAILEKVRRPRDPGELLGMSSRSAILDARVATVTLSRREDSCIMADSNASILRVGENGRLDDRLTTSMCSPRRALREAAPVTPELFQEIAEQ